MIWGVFPYFWKHPYFTNLFEQVTDLFPGSNLNPTRFFFPANVEWTSGFFCERIFETKNVKGQVIQVAMFIINMNSTISIGSTPHPATVTTRIITFLVGNPYKSSFATVYWEGGQPKISNAIPILTKQLWITGSSFK